MIEAAGAALPYRPNFNPIKHAFAKAPSLRRLAVERTVDGLCHAIGSITERSTAFNSGMMMSGCASTVPIKNAARSSSLAST